jgi:hypothetical protein
MFQSFNVAPRQISNVDRLPVPNNLTGARLAGQFEAELLVYRPSRNACEKARRNV